MSDASWEPLNTGDVNDDDALYVDQIVESVQSPPAMTDAPRQVATPEPSMRTLSRIISTTNRVDANTYNKPMMIVPADPERKSLRIQVMCENASGYMAVTPFVRIGSSDTAVQSRQISALVSDVINLDNHTGALWILVESIGAPADGWVNIASVAVSA